jgi:hypothetical protein
MECQIPVRAEDLKSLRLDLFGPPGAYKKRDVATGLGEASTEVPADGARTYDQSAHGWRPLIL